MIRVLIVDDSLLARAVLEKMVHVSPGMEVVGRAVNGEEALQQIPRLNPHVVCTDLHMPKMDGLALTREIMRRHPLPILVVSISVHHEKNDENIFELLAAGAIDVFPKPRGGLGGADARLTRELANKIRILSGVVPIRRHTRTWPAPLPSSGVADFPPAFPRSPAARAPSFVRVAARQVEPVIVAIGASTGGPQALTTILSSLPAWFPLPILCVQHISLGFLEEMIYWLDKHTPLSVQMGTHGTQPKPGNVYFAPENKHMNLSSSGSLAMEPGVENDLHCPAVDVVFHALARVHRARAIAVQLTGMGRDGAAGMLAVSQAQGITMAQDETSSVIFGMPQQAIELGAVQHVLPLTEIAPALCRAAGVAFPS